jgi:hypothetical protein
MLRMLLRARPTAAISSQVFEAALERVRVRFELCVYTVYVVMLEHVHLLLSDRGKAPSAQ